MSNQEMVSVVDGGKGSGGFSFVDYDRKAFMQGSIAR